MCIINRPVQSVNNTLLFGGKLNQPYEFNGKKFDKQITIYSNNVNTSQGNEMILPFFIQREIPHEDQVVLYDLSDMKQNIFKSIDTLFARSMQFLLAPLASNSRMRFEKEKALPVISIGSYQVTICYSLEDLMRLDTSVFKLSEGVDKLLSLEYPRGYGFLICKLDPTKSNESKEYEPFAYSTFMINPTRIFLPTLHFHDDKEDTTTFVQKHSSSEHELWDHKIYVYNYKEGLPNNDEWSWNGSLCPAVHELESIIGNLGSCNSFTKTCINGNSFPNQDLWITVN